MKLQACSNYTEATSFSSAVLRREVRVVRATVAPPARLTSGMSHRLNNGRYANTEGKRRNPANQLAIRQVRRLAEGRRLSMAIAVSSPNAAAARGIRLS